VELLDLGVYYNGVYWAIERCGGGIYVVFEESKYQ